MKAENKSYLKQHLNHKHILSEVTGILRVAFK